MKFLQDLLHPVFLLLVPYFSDGLAGSVLALFLFLLLGHLFFFIFPKYRTWILFFLNFAFATLAIHQKVLFVLFLYISVWFLLLRKMDECSESIKSKLLAFTLIFHFSLFFFIMNASSFGLSLPESPVQTFGLSYLIWRLLHVSVDWRKSKIENKSYFHLLLYIFYFPTLMGGPIERIQRFQSFPFFKTEKWKTAFNSKLLLRILIGSLKIALCFRLFDLDYSKIWNHALSLEYPVLLKIFYFRAIAFYLMVSGANDINISFSSSLGMPLCENYHYPYFQKNLSGFWRNWHMSLSSILSEYIYEPLGGKRKHQYRNYILTFFLCGMWHDTSIAFCIWGLMHGCGLLGLRLWQNFCNGPLHEAKIFLSKFSKPVYVVSTLITFHFVALSWLPFWGGHPQGTIVMLRVLGLEKAALTVAKIAGYFPY